MLPEAARSSTAIPSGARSSPGRRAGRAKPGSRGRVVVFVTAEARDPPRSIKPCRARSAASAPRKTGSTTPQRSPRSGHGKARDLEPALRERYHRAGFPHEEMGPRSPRRSHRRTRELLVDRRAARVRCAPDPRSVRRGRGGAPDGQRSGNAERGAAIVIRGVSSKPIVSVAQVPFSTIRLASRAWRRPRAPQADPTPRRSSTASSQARRVRVTKFHIVGSGGVVCRPSRVSSWRVATR